MNGEPSIQSDPSSYEPSSVVHWEREWKRTERSEQVPAAMWLVAMVVLLGLGSSGQPILSPVLISVGAIWFVLGRGSVAVRCTVLLLAEWYLGRVLGSGDLIVALVACGTLSMLGIGVAGLLVSRILRAPTRGAQFAIWDLAGYMLVIGAGVAMVREDVNEIVRQSHWDHLPWEGVFSMLIVSFSTVLASLSVLIPKRYRDGTLFSISAGLVLLVMPILECVFLLAFGFVESLFDLVGVPFGHLIGALLVWALVFTMESAGALRDGVSATSPHVQPIHAIE